MSSYRGDLSDSDREDLESWKPQTCRFCGGAGYISRFRQTGNPMAADPCGCDEADDDAPSPPADHVVGALRRRG